MVEVKSVNFSKKCLICKGGKKNDCLYWHIDEKTGLPWVWCSGKCQRGYSLKQYCAIAGVDLDEFIKNGIQVVDSNSYEINAMKFPENFVTLGDSRAIEGVEYLNSRKISASNDLYYDIDREGIVFPYYYENVFVGAQVRFIREKKTEDGDAWKITTIPGTRLSLLFYGWNQSPLIPHIKGLIVTEGAFNAISIQQVLDSEHGGSFNNPWKAVAMSGSGVSDYQAQVMRELVESGYKVVAAPDYDEAGIKMLKKLAEKKAVTHFSMTYSSKDWNDLLIEDEQMLLNTFLSNISKI